MRIPNITMPFYYILGGDNAENFRNRKNFFSFNVQTTSDPDMRITDIVARWQGSSHDQNIFNHSAIRARFENGDFGNSLILGDSGYASRPYLVTPIRHPVLPEEHLFNESQIRTRSTVERQYGTWKRRFPVLSLGIRLALQTVQQVIVACAVLHNIAIDMHEDEPPMDPELPALDVLRDQIPRERAPQEVGAVQRALLEYFRNLL
jgi:nuclease HARBI1